MSKHTPGPWFAEKHLNHATKKRVISIQTREKFDDMSEDDDPTIAGIHSTDKVDWHNAHLMAAAPDLLEALETALFDAENTHPLDSNYSWADVARKAIARAKGESS